MAASVDMPVILHTKGQEREVLSCIEPYSMPMLVHWYSSMQYLEGYLEKGCYFSVGPDVFTNPAVQKLVETIPLNRLLVETDGMAAVRWAAAQQKWNARVADRDLPDVLQATVRYIAKVKGVGEMAVEKQIEYNFHFLKGYRECHGPNMKNLNAGGCK